MMTGLLRLSTLLGVALLLLGGCATRPINPPIAKVEADAGYRFEQRQSRSIGVGKETLVILAFSGGGTRAAAFSYGVLEYLRQTRIADAKGRSVRLLDEVDLITGVSGGSFTALAYGLYGEKLFDEYESRFLKRNVQGEIVARTLNPANWGRLASPTWGRSELAAQLELLLRAGTPENAATRDCSHLPCGAAHRPRGARHKDRLSFLRLSEHEHAVPRRKPRHAEDAERGRDRCHFGIEAS
jgi:NTE family protein